MLLMFSCAAFAEPRKAGVEALITAVGAKADPSIVNEPFSVDFTPDGTMYGVEFTKANRSGANQSDHFPMVRSGLMTRAQR